MYDALNAKIVEENGHGKIKTIIALGAVTALFASGPSILEGLASGCASARPGPESIPGLEVDVDRRPAQPEK